MTPLSPELIAAYCRTSYWAELPHACLRLQLEQRNEEFDRFLEERGVGEWAFITAANPRSQLLTPAENAARAAALKAAVEQRRYTAFPGYGVGIDPSWEPEESLLVCGIEIETARALAREFGQHAIVFGQTGDTPRLAFCFPEEAAAAVRAARSHDDPHVRRCAERAIL